MNKDKDSAFSWKEGVLGRTIMHGCITSGVYFLWLVFLFYAYMIEAWTDKVILQSHIDSKYKVDVQILFLFFHVLV